MINMKLLDYGYRPVAEILNIPNYKLSRCFLRDYEEAQAIGFTKSEVEDLVKRVNKGKEAIRQDGWDHNSTFIIGKVANVDGWVIVDGQGRKLILLDLIEEGVIDLSLMVFAFFNEYATFEDMEKHIALLNSSKVKTPYKSDALFRIKQLSGNDKSAIEAYNICQTKKEEWGCASSGIVSTLIFNYDTVRRTNDIIFKIEDVDEFRLKLYDLLFKGITLSMLKAKFDEKLIVKTKNYSSGEAYMQIINNLFKVDNTGRLSIEFVKRFIKIIAKFSTEEFDNCFTGARNTRRTNMLLITMKGLKEGNELLSALRSIYGKFAQKTRKK